MALYSTYLVWFFTDPVSRLARDPVSMALSFIGGALIERVVIRPVEQSSPLVHRDRDDRPVPRVQLARRRCMFGTDAEDCRARTRHTGSRATCDLGRTLVLVGGARRRVPAAVPPVPAHEVGLALRAVASNPESSRLVGIPSGTMLMLGWGLAAALGALAGSLVVPTRTGFTPASCSRSSSTFSRRPRSVASTARSARWSAVSSSGSQRYVQYVHALDGIEVVVPFALILLVLLVRPNGLFGTARVERV